MTLWGCLSSTQLGASAIQDMVSCYWWPLVYIIF